MTLNFHAVRAIYRFEMARTFRTVTQSIASPVLTTSLYFVVFGAAIGSRMGAINSVSYGAFIIPGLVMLTMLKACPMPPSVFICRNGQAPFTSCCPPRSPGSRCCWAMWAPPPANR